MDKYKTKKRGRRETILRVREGGRTEGKGKKKGGRGEGNEVARMTSIIYWGSNSKVDYLLAFER